MNIVFDLSVMINSHGLKNYQLKIILSLSITEIYKA